MLRRELPVQTTMTSSAMARPVVLGDPVRQLPPGQPVRFVDHVERRGERIGVLPDLGQQPHAALRHGGIHRLADFLRVEPAIGPGQFLERFRLHKSSSFGKRQLPFLAESLEQRPLDPLIVGRIGGLGRPIPLDQPECPHQRPHVAAGCRASRQSQGRDERKMTWRIAPHLVAVMLTLSRCSMPGGGTVPDTSTILRAASACFSTSTRANPARFSRDT